MSDWRFTQRLPWPVTPVSFDQTSRTPPWSTPVDDAEMFELAPVALMLEDLSKLRRLFRQWRSDGVTGIRDHLQDDPTRIRFCYQQMHLLKVNRQTLRLFDAADFPALLESLPFILGHVSAAYMEQLVLLWDEQRDFSFLTEMQLPSGRQLHVRVHGTVLPGHEADWGRVLIAFEDVTVQEQAVRGLTISERYARSLFEQSPASLWVNDFSGVKLLLDDARAEGVTDFPAYAAAHPEFALRCLHAIRVIDVNRQTLEMFAAPDKATLFARFGDITRDDMLPEFVGQLGNLWNGKTYHQCEMINYTLTGRPLDLLTQLSLIPGHENDWALVLVALTDITARKKAEAHLEFLGHHDPLTGLHNRLFYLNEIARLDRRGPYPMTVVIADLNGLKEVNDSQGHDAGDALLRRAGDVLRQAAGTASCVARIGGDEFALILPGAGEDEASLLIERIELLLCQDNEATETAVLRLSLGASTCHGTGCLESAVRHADLKMYDAKRAYYAATRRRDRRRSGR